MTSSGECEEFSVLSSAQLHMAASRCYSAVYTSLVALANCRKPDGLSIQVQYALQNPPDSAATECATAEAAIVAAMNAAIQNHDADGMGIVISYMPALSL